MPKDWHTWKLTPQAKGVLAVQKAVRRGDLAPVKSVWCIGCMKPACVYHHYNGYAPEHLLDVVPLCNSCHTISHQIDGTYRGFTEGCELDIVRARVNGVSVKQLAVAYQCTKDTIRRILRAYLHPKLPLSRTSLRSNTKKGLTTVGIGGILCSYPVVTRPVQRRKEKKSGSDVSLSWLDTFE